MRKGLKKVFSVLTSIVLMSGLIGVGGAPLTVHADEPDDSIGIVIDGSLDESGTQKVETFDVDGTDVVLTFVQNISPQVLDGNTLRAADASRETVLATLSGAVASITGYDPETMEIILESRESQDRSFVCVLGYTSADGFFRADGSDGGILTEGEFHLGIVPKRGGGQPGPGPSMDGIAHITANSTDVSWQGYPCVYEPSYPYTGDDGKVNWICDEMKSWQFCSVSVNGGQFGHFFDGDRHSPDSAVVNEVDVNYDPAQDEDYVDLTFSFNWGYRPYDVININGAEYKVNDYVDFDDRIDWLNAFSFEYRNQDISFTIPHIPANLDGEGVANLSIIIDMRPISTDECYIGNFLWSSNPANDRPDDDMYIGHSELTLVNVTYPDWLDSAVFNENVIAAESRLPKSEKTAKYITYGQNNGDGEMVIPVGSKVTMRIAPEFGYQVTEFTINGRPIDREEYGTGEAIAVYTFTITEANFHLGAKVVPVDNEVCADKADGISSGSITLGGQEQSMSIGTAKLEVADIDPSSEQISAFEGAAGDHEITDYVDISLFNSIYKGTEEERWDTRVQSLDNSAVITLALSGDVNGDDVVIIHEKHDGTFETIETEYDAADNVISFRTDSFSSFAIAVGTDETKDLNLAWYSNEGKKFWYEEGVRQGIESDPKAVVYDNTVRGREIYDPESKAWYWLDACYDGAAAKNKEVFIPYVYQNEKDWDEDTLRAIAYESDPGMEECVLNALLSGTGKWVRYDENGAMMKGWVTIKDDLADIYSDQAGNTYYYDYRTGLMAKGTVTIDGFEYHFDEITGVCLNYNGQ